MDKVLNTSCLQKPKEQTLQFIPDRPRKSFRVLGKRADIDGNVKEYRLKGKERSEIERFLECENRELMRKYNSRITA